MKDPSIQINFGSNDRLWSEEIMHLELNPIPNISRESILRGRNDTRKILDYKFKVRVCASELNCGMAF
jgi:hypothetical protein